MLVQLVLVTSLLNVSVASVLNVSVASLLNVLVQVVCIRSFSAEGISPTSMY